MDIHSRCLCHSHHIQVVHHSTGLQLDQRTSSSQNKSLTCRSHWSVKINQRQRSYTPRQYLRQASQLRVVQASQQGTEQRCRKCTLQSEWVKFYMGKIIYITHAGDSPSKGPRKNKAIKWYWQSR
jgi:hypothetical protein